MYFENVSVSVLPLCTWFYSTLPLVYVGEIDMVWAWKDAVRSIILCTFLAYSIFGVLYFKVYMIMLPKSLDEN